MEKLRKDKQERHNERMLFEREKCEKMYAIELRRQESREQLNGLIEEYINLINK